MYDEINENIQSMIGFVNNSSFCMYMSDGRKHQAGVAQWLTHFACNEKIPGSNPGSSFWLLLLYDVQSVCFYHACFIMYLYMVHVTCNHRICGREILICDREMNMLYPQHISSITRENHTNEKYNDQCNCYTTYVYFIIILW